MTRAPNVIRRSVLSRFVRWVDRLWFDSEQGVWDDEHPYGNCCMLNGSIVPVANGLGAPSILVGANESAFDNTVMRHRGLTGDHAFTVALVGDEKVIYDPWALLYLGMPPVVRVDDGVRRGYYPDPSLWEPSFLAESLQQTAFSDWERFFNEEIPLQTLQT